MIVYVRVVIFSMAWMLMFSTEWLGRLKCRAMGIDLFPVLPYMLMSERVLLSRVSVSTLLLSFANHDCNIFLWLGNYYDFYYTIIIYLCYYHCIMIYFLLFSFSNYIVTLLYFPALKKTAVISRKLRGIKGLFMLRYRFCLVLFLKITKYNC